MKLHDVAATVAAAGLLLVPVYLLAQLVRELPEVFGPVALLLLAAALLVVLLRWHQRAMAAERAADRVELDAAAELLDAPFIHEPHHDRWEAQR